MNGDNITIVFPRSSSASLEMADQSGIVVEGSRLCPLCQSEIRPFFINYNEKMLMCENYKCEFPFGYEDLQFVKEDNDVESNKEIISFKSNISMHSSTPTSSIGTGAHWTELERLNQIACESDDSQFTETISYIQNYVQRSKNTEKEKEEQMLKHIQDVKELNIQLAQTIKEDRVEVKIKNEKWIKNLKNIQEISGVQLLKPEEIQLLKKEEPVLGLGELKIDIDPGRDNNLSSITIEIHNSHSLSNEQMQEPQIVS